MGQYNFLCNQFVCLLYCFILILNDHSIFGNCIPTDTCNDCVKPGPMSNEISTCTDFRTHACCNATIIQFIEKYIFPAYQGVLDECQTCIDGWKKVMCAVACSPNQTKFISYDWRTSRFPTLYLCKGLCKSLYHACSDEMLPPPKKSRVRYTYRSAVDFCKSGIVRLDATFGLLIVEVSDRNNSNGCLHWQDLSSDPDFRIKPYCLAHRGISSTAIFLAVTIIPFALGVIISNHLKQKNIYYFPEAGVMILMGIFYGVAVIHGSNSAQAFSELVFDQKLFTLFLLPPIIFKSGYSFRKEKFLKSFDKIFLYAVFGTSIATFLIGPILYSSRDLFLSDLRDSTFSEWMTFAALISASDPVATLAIFKNIKVEEKLGVLIFGEGLISDVTAVILFTTFKTFVENRQVDAMLAFTNFLLIGMSSPLIGVIHGILSSLIFKYVVFAYDNFFLETTLFITVTYSSFIVAEALHLSGIISVLICGMVCEHYTYQNLTEGAKELTLLWYEQMSTWANLMVFYMLGMMVVVTFKDLSVSFTMFCFLMIMFTRILSILPITLLVNACHSKKNQVTWRYAIMLWFSGFRGAIAVTFVLDLPSTMREEMTAATVTLSVLTVFLFGGMTPTALTILGIETGVKLEPKKSVVNFSNEEVKHMVGIDYIDNRYVKPLLIKKHRSYKGRPHEKLDNIISQLQTSEKHQATVQSNAEKKT